VRVVPGPKEEPETRPFVLRFRFGAPFPQMNRLRRPHLAPAPGGLVLVLGRLVGEAFPLP
jgi:hypothetical protein